MRKTTRTASIAEYRIRLREVGVRTDDIVFCSSTEQNTEAYHFFAKYANY